MFRPQSVSPYLLLVLTTLFWSGNFVLARFVRLDVPPIGLSFWRWGLAGALLLPFAWSPMRRAWPQVRAHLRLVILLSLLGVMNFNTFVYLGLQSTTATNATMLQSVIPLVIILLSWPLLGVAPRLGQLLGIACSMVGVLIIISRGDLPALFRLEVARGDLWILAAMVSWGLYSVLLRKLPQALGGLAFLGYSIGFGLIGIAPLYGWEMSTGRLLEPNAITLSSICYVALFPSLLAYLFWNRSVNQVGPARAGLFIYLIPVFGVLLSWLLLGEQLHPFHLTGVLCIAFGIYLANWWRADSKGGDHDPATG